MSCSRHRATRRLPAAWGQNARRCAAAVVLALAAPGMRAAAQDMDVPVAIQVPLFLKVLTFDRRLTVGAEDTLVVAIAFQRGYRASASVQTEVARSLALVNGQRVRVEAIDLDEERLLDALARTKPHALYVAPMRAIDIADVASATRASGVTTMTGVARYVGLGLAVGVRLQGERAKLLINIGAARAEGADFRAELLKLAQVTQ